MQPRTIVAITGSLRNASISRALINAVADAMPEHVTINILQASDFPLYDGDVVSEWDQRLSEIQQTVAEADGVLVCTPEYNGSYSGVVKNTIDWLSSGRHPFQGKPVAAIAVSGGISGGADAVNHLRTVLMQFGAPYMPTPRLAIPRAGSAFDEGFRLVDEAAQRHVERFAPAFVEWVETFSS